MNELKRDIDGAIAETLRVAEGIGVPEGQVSTLSAIMHEVAHAAVRLGYERGFEDGSKKPPALRSARSKRRRVIRKSRLDPNLVE